LSVRAPLIQAQIVETYLLAMVGFQTMVATKASRLVEAAGGRSVVEFGTRRAHSPEAGVLAGRAAYIGGCAGTSNTKTGHLYGVPVFGTAAHSWVLAFESELESYRELQRLLGEATIYLVDSYDTLEGTRQAASLGGPMWGVRLDSGNLVELSRAVRRILDESGFPDAKIMVTGDLNEYKILELMKENLPIDAFGVGTELATSADDPKLGVVYKLVELESEGGRRFTAKFSEDKHTWPGAKQVFRYPGHDLVSGAWEPAPASEPPPKALLETVVSEGRLKAKLPGAIEARERATEGLKQLRSAYRSLFAIDPPYPVERSAELRALLERTRRQIQGD
jgi:nicotinate phosphoribosyltransferase